MSAFEVFRVEASSFSDFDEKRMRGLSDMTSDQENSYNSVSNTYAIIPRESSLSMQHSPPDGVLSAMDFGTYFAEFSRNYLQFTATQRRPTELLDADTSLKEFKRSSEETGGSEVERNSNDLKWMELVTRRDVKDNNLQASTNPTLGLSDDSLNFENVSNAAFIDYTTQNSAYFQGSSGNSASGSTSTASPIISDRDMAPIDSRVKAEAKEELQRQDVIDTKPSSTETQVGSPQIRQPITYKEALEKKAYSTSTGNAPFIPITRTSTDTNFSKMRSSIVARSHANLKESVKVDDESSSTSSNGRRRHEDGDRYGRRRRSMKKQQQRESQNSSEKPVSSQTYIAQKMMQNYQSHHLPKSSSIPIPGANTRVPASPNDICKVITKSIESLGAERSGSDISNLSRQSSSVGNVGVKSNPMLKVRTLEQPQEQVVVEIPENAVPYSIWTGSFRMPAAYAPKCAPNVFKFPYSPRSDANFLAQLDEFRLSLQLFEGKPIEKCKFEDFEPKLNFFGASASSTPKSTDRRVYTNSVPIKVFDAPPVRAWIPVRCDALGVDLRHEKNVDGHAGKGGGKAQVSVVYDANKSTPERKVLYIRKEYYDLEYFTNEYNFLQFANHYHLPKPLCVEYDPYPTILMDFVPGERVHMAFYHFGLTLQENYPDDPILQRKKMSVALSKVLAKILVALKYIHSIGFIHADLKPENIICDLLSGRVFIIDFDLSVSAPYVFTGRGTNVTVAPETNGLLRGPVHFGIDWWAYGSTAAMTISAALAGLCGNVDHLVEELIHYVPFKYNRSTNQYEMTPIPKYFSPVMRSFLYPFFNPDPSNRVFSEANAYNWIRSHVMFECVEDWKKYEQVDFGGYASLSPIQLGFMNFSNSPRLLKPVNRINKLFSGISNGLSHMLSVFGGGKAETAVVSKAEEEEEDDEDEDSVEEQFEMD